MVPQGNSLFHDGHQQLCYGDVSKDPCTTQSRDSNLPNGVMSSDGFMFAVETVRATRGSKGYETDFNTSTDCKPSRKLLSFFGCWQITLWIGKEIQLINFCFADLFSRCLRRKQFWEHCIKLNIWNYLSTLANVRLVIANWSAISVNVFNLALLFVHAALPLSNWRSGLKQKVIRGLFSSFCNIWNPPSNATLPPTSLGADSAIMFLVVPSFLVTWMQTY